MKDRPDISIRTVRAKDLRPGDIVMKGSGTKVYWRIVADAEVIKKGSPMRPKGDILVNYTDGFGNSHGPYDLIKIQKEVFPK